MNPWDALAMQGRPSLEEVQAQEGSQGVPGNINLWAGVPENDQVKDPSGEPTIRGKTRRFEGHWENNGGNHKFVTDKVWYEDDK
jgi:hypothetical protein